MKTITLPFTIEQIVDVLGDAKPGDIVTLRGFKWWDGTVADHDVRLATPEEYRECQKEGLEILNKAVLTDLPPDIPTDVALKALTELRESFKKNLEVAEAGSSTRTGPAYEQIAGPLSRLHGNVYLMRAISLDIKPLTSLPKRDDARARALVSEFLSLPTSRYLHVVKLTEDYVSGVSIG